MLDANAGIIVEKENFSHAFTTLYAGVVDYRPGCTVTQLNSAQRWVTYNQVELNGEPVVTNGQIQAAVLNPIPPQRAPQLLKDAGLLTDPLKPFAPVDVRTYQSTAKPVHPRHRRRQPDDATEGRTHRQPAGQDLRRRHPAPAEQSSR